MNYGKNKITFGKNEQDAVSKKDSLFLFNICPVLFFEMIKHWFIFFTMFLLWSFVSSQIYN